MTSFRYSFRLCLFLILALSPVTVFSQTSVDPWRPATTETEPQASLLMAPPQPEMMHRISLPPMERARIDAMLERNRQQKRLEIGLPRTLGDDVRRFSLGDLYWRQTAQGDRVATVAVESANARAMRVALDVDSLPAGLVIRFHPENDPERVFGPYDRSRLQELARFSKEGIYWSPIVEGQSLAMELSVPAASDVRSVELNIPMVSHLVTSPREGFSFKDIGDSGACNVDLHCESDSSWHDTGDSVAKYAFTESGSTYTCTGTLLNDQQDTGTPYFLSANHCVSTDTVAATVQTYWFFEAGSCDGSLSSASTQQTGGAQLLETGTTTDYTLMELNDTPPGGVVYAGWTTSTSSVGAESTGIHHPSGDLKKISFGTIDGYSSYGGSENDSDGDYIRMLWTVSGTTEGGSSGSGLFNSSRQVIGTLTGGAAGCDGSQDNGEPDWYGRFDVTHACISDHVGGSTVTSCPDDGDGGGSGGGGGGTVVSLSSGSSQSGSVGVGEWDHYSIEVPSGANRLVVKLTGLTADGDLYVQQGSVPTSSDYECRPYESGTTSETCALDGPAAGTWYVSVNGYEATDYSVEATVKEGGGGGSSGGCSLAGDNTRDPVLLLLVLVAFMGLSAGRRRLAYVRR